MNNAYLYFGLFCYGLILVAMVLCLARAWYVRKDRADGESTRQRLDAQRA